MIDENNKPPSEKQLFDQLENIVKSSEKKAPEIGVLTTDNRNAWGKAYQELIKGILFIINITTGTYCIFSKMRKIKLR